MSTIQRVLHRLTGSQGSVILVALFVSTSTFCSDQAPTAIAAEPPVVPLAPDSSAQVPRPPSNGLRLDESVLKSLDTVVVEPGSRVACLAGSGSVNAIASENIRIGDTTVVDFDDEGTFHALTVGTSWVTWSRGAVSDSALVRVTLGAGLAPLSGVEMPELPGQNVDVQYRQTRGRSASRSIYVSPTADLQATLDAAQPGDEVVLASGATFVGNYTLPKKSGAGWIVIRAEVNPVAAGTRNTPSAAAASAKVLTPNAVAAITTAPGAHNWRLVGFVVGLQPTGVHNNGIIRLGQGTERALTDLPSDIILDRMVIRGSATGGTSRCVALNGIRQAVIDSWLDECHAKGSDAQAIAGWGGPGPFLIENNRLEASGEIVMFGGSDPQIAGVIPSDITIRRNHLFRPLSYAGKWTVKNIFELKNARRVLFEGNVMENNWTDGQTGFAIVLKAVSQQNTAPWSTMQDITIRNNILRNSTSGVNLAYRAGTVPQTGTSRVLIVNNLFETVGRDPISGASGGRVFQILNECQDITVMNNTITLPTKVGTLVSLDGVPTVRTQILNNVFPASDFGIKGTGQAVGNASIAHFLVDGRVVSNVFPAASSATYPPQNYFPPSAGLAGFSPGSASDVCTSLRNLLTGQGIPPDVGLQCSTLAAAVLGSTGSPD